MTHGRQVCNTLKQIRRQIADKNEIEYTTSECHFEGECEGTCPKCESEVKYLENELHRRRQLGKAVAVAGISLGMVGTFAACCTSKQNIPLQNSDGTWIGKGKKIYVDSTYIYLNNDKGTNTADGRVFEEDGETPLEMVTVRLMQGEKVILETFTDEKGKFLLDTFPSGEYDLILTYAGYKDYRQWFEIRGKGGGTMYICDVIMSMASSFCKEPDVVCGRPDIHPKYPDGEKARLKFIQENLVYPQEAKEQKIEGYVMIRFVVKRNGELTNFKVVKSLHPLLDAEALRVVKLMPKWEPAWHHKRGTVRECYLMPVNFKLD